MALDLTVNLSSDDVQKLTREHVEKETGLRVKEIRESGSSWDGFSAYVVTLHPPLPSTQETS